MPPKPAYLCDLCERGIEGTVADPVIATTKGRFHYECMRNYTETIATEIERKRTEKMVARADAMERRRLIKGLGPASLHDEEDSEEADEDEEN